MIHTGAHVDGGLVVRLIAQGDGRFARVLHESQHAVSVRRVEHAWQSWVWCARHANGKVSALVFRIQYHDGHFDLLVRIGYGVLGRLWYYIAREHSDNEIDNKRIVYHNAMTTTRYTDLYGEMLLMQRGLDTLDTFGLQSECRL